MKRFHLPLNKYVKETPAYARWCSALGPPRKQQLSSHTHGYTLRRLREKRPHTVSHSHATKGGEERAVAPLRGHHRGPQKARSAWAPGAVSSLNSLLVCGSESSPLATKLFSDDTVPFVSTSFRSREPEASQRKLLAVHWRPG